MTAAPRDIRDVLGECLRRERLGLIRPLWHEYASFNDEACETYRRRADFIVRLLKSYGLSIVPDGATAQGTASPAADTIYSHPLADMSAIRSIRYAAGTWEIVSTKDGTETVEQSFTRQRADINAGLVLQDAPEVRSIQGLGRQLAALVEIYRVHAQDIGGQP